MKQPVIPNVIDFRLTRNARSAIGVFYRAIVSESSCGAGELMIDVTMPEAVLAFEGPDRRQAMMNLAAQAYSVKKLEPPTYFPRQPLPAVPGLSGYIEGEDPNQATTIRMTLTGAAKAWIDELNRQRDKETVAEGWSR